MTMLFKVLDPGGRCRNGGSGSWHLPKGGRPGKWMPRIVDPKACARGYHVCTALQLLRGNWLGPEIWVVEVRGASDRSESGKSCHEQARIVAPTNWNEVTARLFAADCAEKVLPLFESRRPGDDRPRAAIVAARRFALGEITAQDREAAWAAAGAAGRAALGEITAPQDRDAAWAAAGAAWAAAGAAGAAWSAWDAAWDAAWAAAGAAGAAGAAWAAWAAAGAVGASAWDAAWDAAWVAAGRAAGAAAGDAAGDAAWAWQARRLRSYLVGPLGERYAGGGR